MYQMDWFQIFFHHMALLTCDFFPGWKITIRFSFLGEKSPRDFLDDSVFTKWLLFGWLYSKRLLSEELKLWHEVPHNCRSVLLSSKQLVHLPHTLADTKSKHINSYSYWFPQKLWGDSFCYNFSFVWRTSL